MNGMKQLVLASGSTGRREVMRELAIPFVVDVSNYEEDMSLNISPQDLAIYLSKGKAREVAGRHQNAVILAADSFAVFNGELLGKPHTNERAKEMLTMLSGKEHRFITGFTVIDADTHEEYSEAVETRLFFENLTKQDIEDYLLDEDVLAKAGAYNIQGKGRRLFEKIEGDITNVIGLPLENVRSALKRFGVSES